MFFQSLTNRDTVADSHNLMVVLARLQGVAATFRVGRHQPPHHRVHHSMKVGAPLCSHSRPH